MAVLQFYYELLGINENASVDDIKKAFRQKVKQYHSDLNSDPDAQQKFIEIHEAYEVLIHHKTKLFYNNATEQYERTKISIDAILIAAKKRAESFFNTSYSNYKQTPYFSKNKAVKEATYFVELTFYFIVVIVIPVILSFFIGIKYAFWAALGIIVITMPDWIRMLASAPAISREGINEGLKLLRWPKVSIHWILLPAASIIYITIGFQTFITLDEILILQSIFYIIIVLVLIFIKKDPIVKSVFSSLSFAFTAINMMVLLNYFISYGVHKETYSFSSTSVRTSSRFKKPRYGQGSLIRILNDKEFDTYDEYMSIRFFWIYEDIPNQHYYNITYTTKDGLFNYKIYTNRVFSLKLNYDH